MATVLCKLIRKTPPPSLRTLASLTKSHLPSSLLQTPIPSTNHNLLPNQNSTTTSCLPHEYTAHAAAPLQFFPSFPHFLHLDPFPLSLIVYSNAEPDSGGEDGGRTVWADSVKKKRKRKMNRHKYRKLKKRLRRQT